MDGPWAMLQDAVKDCARTPMWARSSRELVEGLDRIQVLSAQLAALGLELLREIDGRAIPAEQGAPNTTAWLRDRYRISAATASQRVKLARALHGQLPAAAAALAAGAINPEQAQLIANAVPELPVEYHVEAEKFLVAQCAQFGPKELGRISAHLLDRIAPEVAEQRAAQQLARDEQRAHDERCLHLTEVHGGARVRLSGWLDRESAAVVRAAIDPLCAPRPQGSRPQHCKPGTGDPGTGGPGTGQPGTGQPGRGVPGTREPGTGGPDPRNPGQRRADALVDVCRLAMARGDLPDNGGDRPQITLTIDLHALRRQVGVATLDDGTVLSPATARRLACDAHILPAVMGGAGQVLDLGRERRLFTGPIRRALVLRDRGCAFPGCDRPPRWCDGHHVISWLDGGPTNLNNGVLLCGYHHRLIHQGHWQVMIAADGLPEFIPPGYIDRQQRPRRNTYHRRE